jgi:hypothetical protein
VCNGIKDPAGRAALLSDICIVTFFVWPAIFPAHSRTGWENYVMHVPALFMDGYMYGYDVATQHGHSSYCISAGLFKHPALTSLGTYGFTIYLFQVGKISSRAAEGWSCWTRARAA